MNTQDFDSMKELARTKFGTERLAAYQLLELAKQGDVLQSFEEVSRIGKPPVVEVTVPSMCGGPAQVFSSMSEALNYYAHP